MRMECRHLNQPRNSQPWDHFGTYGEQEPIIDAVERRRIRKAKHEGLNFHELRHTQATLLIGSGADIKTVQTRLGHSSAQLTMNTYAHTIEANDRDAADTIGEMLFGKVTHGCFKDKLCQKFNRSVKLSA